MRKLEVTSTTPIENVIANGCCIGCGACTAHKDSPFEIRLTQLGMYSAGRRDNRASKEVLEEISKVCPFAAGTPNETDLAREMYPDNKFDPAIGYYKGLYAGHVAEGIFREKGSSGGFGSWIQAELLKQGRVDYVINVAATGENSLLFRYTISDNPDDVLKGASSKYYPVEMSEILSTIQSRPGRYALVGIPCFIKAFRLLAVQDRTIRDRVVFTIGLVCGHLKSTRFAEFLAWQLGAPPGTLETVNFRKKIENRRATVYGVEATWSENGVQKYKMSPTSHLLGGNWGHGFFKYKACDYCDDVFAETADIVIGDAWLKRFIVDSRGTSVVITRSPDLDSVIQEGIQQQRISAENISEAEMIQSQASGLRHKRENLQYRLWLDESEGRWHPPKRVESLQCGLSPKEQAKQQVRIQLRDESHRVYAKYRESGEINRCLNQLGLLSKKHDNLGLTPIRKFKKSLKYFISRTRKIFKVN